MVDLIKATQGLVHSDYNLQNKTYEDCFHNGVQLY